VNVPKTKVTGVPIISSVRQWYVHG